MHSSENKGPEEPAFNDKYNGEVRKKRDEYVVEIRRQKREGILNKKRNTTLDNDKKTEKNSIAEFEADDNMDPNTKALKAFIEDCLKSVYTMEEFPGVVEAVASKDKFQQYYGVIGLRKILSTEADPPIQATIDQNLVPRLITYMQRDDEPRLQLEAAWALTNIASGTSQQTQSIIDKNGIPAFVRLLKSPRQDIAEQALWAIGNISGDSPIFRDMILKYGALEPLISIINNAKNEMVLQHGTWALSNLCRGRPQPKFESVYKAIPIFSYVIQKTNQSETLADAAWAMTFLTDGKDERIEMVVQTGIIPSLVKHIETEHLTILIPMLRTLGNILTGNERQTSMVLDIPGVVDKLFNLLNFKHKAVQREACWAISNITGGSSKHIECVIKDPAHIRTILSLVESDAPELRREAIWVLSNATCNANADQMVRLCQHGLIECFCELLESEDPHVLEVVLIGLKNIFECGVSLAQQYNTENKFLLEFEIKGGTQKIEKLQTHQSNPVYTKALHLLETYFEIEDSFQ